MLGNLENSFISANNADNSKNYVAVALYINASGEGQHSGLLINFNNELKLFHFTSREVLIEDFEDLDEGKWYYYKSLDIIHPDEVETFLHHCKLIAEKSAPKWALVFDGSYFKNGVYFTNSGLKEYTTCVGFCINVVKGFLDSDEYINLDDWDSSSTDSWRDAYTQTFTNMLLKLKAENPDIKNIEENFVKRITPIEYSVSAYFLNLPIRKLDLDPHVPKMEGYVALQRP